MDAILELVNIQTFIGQYHILQDVSLQVPCGAVTALLGRNGAGKTTTLKSILGLTPPRLGEIFFEGASLKGLPSFEIASRGIGYVPEHRAIFRNLSVEENLRIAERKKGDYARRKDFLFNLFPDLQRLIGLSGGRLSGGQQQMLAIARALVPENHLLLIDEPSEGLAPVVIEQLINAIRQVAVNCSVILVEQNFLVASLLAHNYTIIEEGCSVKIGRMVDLENDKVSIQRFLGAA